MLLVQETSVCELTGITSICATELNGGCLIILMR